MEIHSINTKKREISNQYALLDHTSVWTNGPEKARKMKCTLFDTL